MHYEDEFVFVEDLHSRRKSSPMQFFLRNLEAEFLDLIIRDFVFFEKPGKDPTRAEPGGIVLSLILGLLELVQN